MAKLKLSKSKKKPKSKSKSKTKPKSKYKLNPRQKKFVSEYLLCLNATEAAKKCGYSEKSAKKQGYRMSTNVHLLEEINKQLEIALEQDKTILKAQVIDRLKLIAFSDFNNIDSKVIAATTIRESERGSSKTIKLEPRTPALAKLMEYLGLAENPENEYSELKLIFKLDNRKK